MDMTNPNQIFSMKVTQSISWEIPKNYRYNSALKTYTNAIASAIMPPHSGIP